jgi:hypothetical protein
VALQAFPVALKAFLVVVDSPEVTEVLILQTLLLANQQAPLVVVMNPLVMAQPLLSVRLQFRDPAPLVAPLLSLSLTQFASVPEPFWQSTQQAKCSTRMMNTQCKLLLIGFRPPALVATSCQ